jgi:hypothetical protein
MRNSKIKNALGFESSPLGSDVELLDHELDGVSGGACQSFTCVVFRVQNAKID